MTSENSVEKALKEGVELLGGRCVKLPARWYKGIPDRAVLLPGGRVFFVELKRPDGGRMEKMQNRWREWLIEAGFYWCVIDSRQMVEAFLNEARR